MGNTIRNVEDIQHCEEKLNTSTSIITSKVLAVSLQSTEHPPQYWWHPSSLLNIIYSQYWRCPPQYWWYGMVFLYNDEHSPLFWWYHSTVLVLFRDSIDAIPTVINTIQCTYGIPKQHWCYPSTVLILSLHLTNVIPTVINTHQCTDSIPHIIKYPLHCGWYP